MANGDHPPDCPAYYTSMDVPKHYRPYCTCPGPTMTDLSCPAHGEDDD